MGCSTVDIQGLPLTLVIPDESVSDPLLSDNLVSAGCLMEVGFEVISVFLSMQIPMGFSPTSTPCTGVP